MLALLAATVLCAAPDAPPPRDKLRLGLAYRSWGRNAEYRNTDVESQAVGLQAGATIDVQWFPAAYFTQTRGADVGVTLRADFAPTIDSTFGASTFKTAVSRVRTGLMFRVPFRYVEPSAHLGFNVFEATTSTFATDKSPRPRFPNVTYQGPRVAIALRLIELWRITFDLGVGATFVVTKGELASAAYFPTANGGSYDGWLGIGLRTWDFLDLRIGVDAAITSLALGNGGVLTDTYYGFTFGLVFKGLP